MLAGNPELEKVFSLVLHLDDGASIYVIPGVYLVTLYLVWANPALQLRRLSVHDRDGLSADRPVHHGLPPGWLVWSLPFLAYYQITGGRITAVLVGSFSAAYVLSTLLVSPIQFSGGYVFDPRETMFWTAPAGDRLRSLLHTGMVGIGAALAIRVWRDIITRNNFFRLSRKPFVVGVAGDSGAGKDHLANALTGLFGDHSIAPAFQ